MCLSCLHNIGTFVAIVVPSWNERIHNIWKIRILGHTHIGYMMCSLGRIHDVHFGHSICITTVFSLAMSWTWVCSIVFSANYCSRRLAVAPLDKITYGFGDFGEMRPMEDHFESWKHTAKPTNISDRKFKNDSNDVWLCCLKSMREEKQFCLDKHTSSNKS